MWRARGKSFEEKNGAGQSTKRWGDQGRKSRGSEIKKKNEKGRREKGDLEEERGGMGSPCNL